MITNDDDRSHDEGECHDKKVGLPSNRVKCLTMLLQPTFARAPLSGYLPIQRFVLSMRLVASIRAVKGG